MSCFLLLYADYVAGTFPSEIASFKGLISCPAILLQLTAPTPMLSSANSLERDLLDAMWAVAYRRFQKLAWIS